MHCVCVLCASLPPQSAGLENLQEELKIPNHRVPLSALGVQQSFAAGQLVHQLLHDARDHHNQQQQRQSIACTDSNSSSSSSSNREVDHCSDGRRSCKVFLYTSPFLRCIQTAQHVVRALTDEQVRPFILLLHLRAELVAHTASLPLCSC